MGLQCWVSKIVLLIVYCTIRLVEKVSFLWKFMHFCSRSVAFTILKNCGVCMSMSKINHINGDPMATNANENRILGYADWYYFHGLQRIFI